MGRWAVREALAARLGLRLRSRVTRTVGEATLKDCAGVAMLSESAGYPRTDRPQAPLPRPRVGPRSSSSEGAHLARAHLARAHLALGDLDAVGEYIAPALAATVTQQRAPCR